jgi:hypothetical protein
MPLNESSVESADGLACDGLEAARTDVVAQWIPGPHDLGIVGRRERLQCRIAVEPLLVLREDAVDLCLLEHDFGHEHTVGVACFAPRQVAPVPAIPGEEPAPEPLPAVRIGLGQGSLSASNGSHRT